MITMTVNDLLNVIPVLREMVRKPFKGGVAFKLARLMRELDKESELFEQSRMQLAEKYAKRKDDGSFELDEANNIILQEDKIVECNEEMMSLLATKLEINADKIPVSAFDDIEIAPSQALVIDTLIDY